MLRNSLYPETRLRLSYTPVHLYTFPPRAALRLLGDSASPLYHPRKGLDLVLSCVSLIKKLKPEIF
jgi:hypothetical protein